MSVSRRNLWLALALIGLAVALPWLLPQATQGYWLSLATRAAIMALAALSLDLVLGLGGLVSFGHAAFLGIGAYAAGIMLVEGRGDVAVALPVALAAGAAFALFSGAVSLRTKGVAFIMITLAFGQMAFFLAQALYAYGGDDGLTLPSRATIAGFRLLDGRVNFYLACLGVLMACWLVLRHLADSRFGRALQATRDNPERAASLGFDVTRIHLTAYVISGMMCALAGFLLAQHNQFVSPAFLSWQRSGELIFMVILGGVGTLTGAIFGAIAFILTEELLSGLTEHWKAIFGPLIILFVLFTRGGIVGLIGKLRGTK
ncbi:MAG: branched-chain amino acid ABC transporter permease [Bosea sp. (in: a-proteobacteria)]